MNDQVQDQEIINGEEMTLERNISIERNNTYREIVYLII